ncbi:MAG TPA: Glu/Leu/Phe/Val dehydrogenase dimerization domain-containing protein [Spirochaetia bacterium]|nr:Glu/Leu/Phe/Val dehydrogenase dimerization domain-containing protein [Spirochaetia bacterium]
MIIEEYAHAGYEQVFSCRDENTGLNSYIAIHNTTRGPALGGLRMYPYIQTEDALTDVLRLARGMTYKSAVADLPLGGGKSVLIGNPDRDKTEAMLRSFGRCIEKLGGHYIVAEDVGTTVADMDLIRRETTFVAGTSDSSGDPSIHTAYGVQQGMRAAARTVYGRDGLKGLTVAIQGLGHVGMNLCMLLSLEGAKLAVTDVNPARIRQAVAEFGAIPVETAAIYRTECDIFAPCAMGAVINDQTIGILKTRIVAGSANNVLAEERHGEMLAEMGILYAPDFVINAGGLINVAEGLNGYNRAKSRQKVAAIYNTMLQVISLARERHISTARAAVVLAEEKLRINAH